MQNAIVLSFVLIMSIITACSFPGVYKIDVQQGNIVEQEALNQLQAGMTRQQVHFVLGSPVVESTFSPEYEAYLYTIQIAGGDMHRQRVLLFYQNDILENIEKRELLPTELANPAEASKLQNVEQEEL